MPRNALLPQVVYHCSGWWRPAAAAWAHIFGTNTPMQWPSWASHFLSLDIFSSGAEYISIKWISNQHGGRRGIESTIRMWFINSGEGDHGCINISSSKPQSSMGFRIRISNCDWSLIGVYFHGIKVLAKPGACYIHFWRQIFGTLNSSWCNAGFPEYNFLR